MEVRCGARWGARTNQGYAFTASVIMLCGLVGCGEYLGDYKVSDVRLVREMPLGDEPSGPNPPYPRYLRVELASTASLYTAHTGPGLYTKADFCPFDNGDALIAFGPQATDGHAVEDWKRQTPLQRDKQDGLYHYFVYIVPSSPARKLFANSESTIPEYNILSQRKPICVRFFVPGYNITASRSNTIEISAEQLSQALIKQGG